MKFQNPRFPRQSPRDSWRSRLFAVLSIATFCLSCAVTAAAPGVTARAGQITIPTYPWAGVKHPYFRGTDKVNIYPYPMLDFLSRDKTNRTYRTVVLENQYLRITFLPELGGRIHEVIDKTTGRPMFYVNHVIKPGLIGQCGAWISGGVEWNTGPQGHTVSSMQPVTVKVLPREEDGSQSVAIGETERIYGTRWTVVVTLRPDRSFIEERIRIYNPTRFIRPYYFWNCTAVPNTPGFRFIYPMTLGCDHAGEKFFRWPIDDGKDLTRGTNYQDASSIFAWHCDQDFFGSYNDDLDQGAVSFANHHQLPGKKAWTWGQGGFGRMHQMDLTDSDGPYNEVQTGPLLTQAQVGRLDPSEAVEWNEWWYPIHALGGFTFANKDVAVNADRQGNAIKLRMLGTATWGAVNVRLLSSGAAKATSALRTLTPNKPVELTMQLPAGAENPRVELSANGKVLASFQVPLDLPKRTQPEKKAKPDAPADIVQEGWEDYLFARFTEAESKFQKALEKDPRLADARTGLAFLKLQRDPAGAAQEAERALAINPESGLGHLVCAAALSANTPRLGTNAVVANPDESAALEHAWKAALDPATAVAGRALAASILCSQRRWDDVITALSTPGPWTSDPSCRNSEAIARFMLGQKKAAAQLAQGTLEIDPLDPFALGLLWLAEPGKASPFLVGSGREAEETLELAGQFLSIKQHELAAKVLACYLNRVPAERRSLLANYWGVFLAESLSAHLKESLKTSDVARVVRPSEALYPYRPEDAEVLAAVVRENGGRGEAALYLGHVLFDLGRYAEGREMWKKAAESGARPVVAYRALGMAAKTLDNDLNGARDWLQKACAADPADAIVARDLAGVLFALADKADSDEAKRKLAVKARDALRLAFESGKSRADFVALLARAHNRLDDFAESARMLDTVRVTVWEGSREVHDLFEQAHLALGEAHLKANRPADALRELDRALEYPENLATGKLENARQAHIQYPRGVALAALGRTAEARAAWKLAADEPESKDANIESARQKAKEALAGK